MLEDIDLLGELTDRETGRSGMAYFVPLEERDYNAEWAKQMRECGWIRHNWELIEEDNPFNTFRMSVGAQIAACNGIILEIGAGPGGGFMPYILRVNSVATVIINGLSSSVVREWKVFLDKVLDSPNLYYAVFDFCNMPFRDNSIDIISDGGGIGNCEGERSKALREAYRVLKPGGKLITSTDFVNKETLTVLPAEVQKVLLEKRPDVFEDLYEDTVLAGFKKVDSVIGGCWYTDDDESSVADLARSLGVNLKFTSYIRYCTKE